MKLKTLLDIYDEEMLKNKTPEGTQNQAKPHIETIPSHIKDLDDVMSSQSPKSQTVLSVTDAKKSRAKDDSHNVRRPEKNKVSSQNKIVKDLASKPLKNESSELAENTNGKFWNYWFIPLGNKTDRIQPTKKISTKRETPSDQVEERKNMQQHSGISELDKSNKDLDFTEDTQQNKTFLKEIINEAGIDLSEDGAKPDHIVSVKDLYSNPAAREKPTFFETSVDVGPYFGPKGITTEAPKPLVYKNLNKNRVFRLGMKYGKIR